MERREESSQDRYEKRQGFIDLHSYMKEKFDGLEERVFPILDDHSKRITGLEKWIWRISGGVAVILVMKDFIPSMIKSIITSAGAR